MKIYRRSFFSAETTKSYFWPIISMTILFTILLECDNIPSLYYLIFMLSFLLTTTLQYFYVIVTEKEIILKNGIFGFWEKRYRYDDIIKVKFKIHHVACRIKVKVRSHKGWWWYPLDLINPGDYRLLINDLREYGIVVETNDVDVYMEKNYPPRKKK